MDNLDFPTESTPEKMLEFIYEEEKIDSHLKFKILLKILENFAWVIDDKYKFEKQLFYDFIECGYKLSNGEDYGIRFMEFLKVCQSDANIISYKIWIGDYKEDEEGKFNALMFFFESISRCPTPISYDGKFYFVPITNPCFFLNYLLESIYHCKDLYRPKALPDNERDARLAIRADYKKRFDERVLWICKSYLGIKHN